MIIYSLEHNEWFEGEVDTDYKLGDDGTVHIYNPEYNEWFEGEEGTHYKTTADKRCSPYHECSVNNRGLNNG
jgi:hypothetical protein